MLKVVYSNKIHQLAQLLAQLHQEDPLPPLETETVIVQSNALARWLSLIFATQHGITSNINFPYPSAYIWSLFRRLLPDVPPQSSFSKDAMAWRIFERLPLYRYHTTFSDINAYLGEQDDPVKRFALSHRIADSFDQYLMYRPDWIEAWEQGQTPHWQAYLWQQIALEYETAPHRANLLKQLQDYLTNCRVRPHGLPQRLAIFGISAMPPVYLTLFELMAHHCDITLFFLTPSQVYWGDLVDPRTHAKQVVENNAMADYAAIGHPLLASLGKQSQEFFEQIQLCEHEVEEAFLAPKRHHLLGKLQHDIFELLQPPLAIEKKESISVNDTSIMIHVCHSAMREIDVLHDQLLALFEANPDLSPTDVVVMTPDIEHYAPWIDAVFGHSSSKQTIAYGISDCGVRYQSPILNSFMTLLGLPQSRFDVESIVTLLECDAIRQRFSLSEDDLAVIRQWLRDTHIHWALSAEHKVEFDVPATPNNTWRSGLDRLLLGYAMPLTEAGQSKQLFQHQLAFDGIIGQRAETMAQLCAFIDCLDDLRRTLITPRKATEWQQVLNNLIATMFTIAIDQEQSELMLIRQTIDKLVESTNLAGFEQPLSLPLVKEWLDGHLDSSETVNRFMGQGVTFCGMVPMRSLPFKVVCLIGMNDDSFPRQQPRQGFDLLSDDFRRGDRSRRDDDRYLFLESIMACESHLYISYVGASIRDNSKIPPSVLVSDLQDVLEQYFESEGGGELWPQLLTRHPLQAFSKRYFDGDDPALFSFSHTQCPPNNTTSDITWFDQPLPQADDSWRQISLSQLIRFYKHPSRYILRERLGMRLEMSDDALDSREPFDLDNLNAWQLRQQLLTSQLMGDSKSTMLSLAQASGVLPDGIIGQQLLDIEVQKIDVFAEKLVQYLPTNMLAPISFELDMNEIKFVGQLNHVYQEGLVFYQMAKTKGHDLLAVWCQHLVLNCIQPQGIALESVLLTETDKVKFIPVDEPHVLLQALIDVYWQGIHYPIAFFSHTSFAFAKAMITGKSSDSAAHAAWSGNPYQNMAGEGDDSYHQQLYASSSPLDENFEHLALAIYAPLFEHLVDTSS